MSHDPPPADDLALSEPVERIRLLYAALREPEDGAGPEAEMAEAIAANDWSLADVYRELGGGGPRSSALHGLFADFFNGQTRSIVASEHDVSKLGYWAGTPPRAAALRDAAIDALAARGKSGSLVSPQALAPEHELDPETRALILAHNQLDVEVHARFASVAARAARPTAAQASASAVCVLGMSRSGTSLTTRILNVLGVDLGHADRLMKPVADNNPKGFWEHQGIVNLNEDILAALSDPPRLPAWVRPPPLPPGWERDPELLPHRRAARNLLRESFAGAPLWGWKDPRACLTLPFWRQLIPDMSYVICVRHPHDVATSLERRDGVPRDYSLRLWLIYTAHAVLNTRGCRRVVVSHEGYFPSWQAQADRLARFVGLGEISPDRRSAIADHVEEGLWHHRDGRDGDEDLPSEVGTLYHLLATLAASDRPDPVTLAALDEAALQGVAVADQA